MAGFDSLTSVSRSSSVERRFTKVVLALRSVSGSRPSAAAERDVLVADRRGGRVRVAHQLREVVAALGERAHRPDGVGDEALEAPAGRARARVTRRDGATSAGLRYRGLVACTPLP